MGGFFLVYISRDEDRSAELASLRQAFAELGFGPPEIIAGENYLFAAYPSFESGSIASKHYPNGDFVFVAGTCVSDKGVGPTAAAMSCGCTKRVTPEDAAMGHYAVVIKRNGHTEIKLDQSGGYHLFYNLDVGIVSSSFYAISWALDRLTLSQQSASEYVFNGVVSGNDTLFREIALAPIGATIRVGPAGLAVIRPKLKATRYFTSATRPESLEYSMSLLDRYFSAVRDIFGDRVGCALSGGYDSRLMLAFLRRHSIKPRVFVYGRAPDRDVSLAGEIARGEGFPLSVIDKSNRPIIPPEEFAVTAHRNFLAQDGYGWGGIFQNDAEIAESARRVHGNAIAFNGGGGEIFRNFFHLPDREYSVRELLWSFYSQFDPSTCTDVFDSTSYYEGLEKKAVDLLGNDEERLSRPTVEWLYHNFRCRSWDGKVDSICLRYGFTAMPYLEPAITEHASALWLRWKNHGAYEAELIKRADHRLAGYSSTYGHDFCGPPPLSRRVRDYATYLRPPWLRRYTYRLRHQRLRRRAGDRPGYLAQAYQNAVLPGTSMHVRQLFRLDRIADADQFARILSLEYALRHFGGRVNVEF